MKKPQRAGRQKGEIEAALDRLTDRLRPLTTVQMRAMATRKAPWQTIYRIARGKTNNPKVRVLVEIERILG